MKKILLNLIFSFSLAFSNYGVEPAGDLDTIDLFLIVKKIQEINEKINIINKIEDINDSEIKKNFTATNKRKNDLLNQIPTLLISKKNIVRKSEKSYKKEKIKLITKIKANEELGLDLVVKKNKIELDILELNNLFDDTLIKLENTRNHLDEKNSITQTLEEAIIAVESINISGYEKFLANNQEVNQTINEIAEKLNELEVLKKTYLDILKYLYKNISALEPKFFFSKMDIGNMINIVNKSIFFKFYNLNFGKLFLIIFVVLFFASLRNLITRLIFFLFTKISRIAKEQSGAKATINNTINKPIYAILTAYSLDLCVQIFLYPQPVSIKFINLMSIFYTILTAWLCISILEGYGTIFISSLTKKNGEIFRREVINLVLKILYFIIIIIATLLILTKMGFNVSALIASLGIGGLAVALATKDILANFFASVMLLFDNSFSQGDWIKCGDVEGTVVEIGLRRTTIRTFDNAMLFVPNSKLANESIRNWNRRKVGRRIKMYIGITYDAPKEKLELCVKDIREMLLSHPLISNPKDTSIDPNNSKEVFRKDIVSIDDLAGYKRTLMVYLDTFSPSSIDILIYCFTKTTSWADWLKVKEDVMLKIMDIVKKHNLRFAFPSQSIYIEDIPEDTFKKLNHEKELK